MVSSPRSRQDRRRGRVIPFLPRKRRRGQRLARTLTRRQKITAGVLVAFLGGFGLAVADYAGLSLPGTVPGLQASDSVIGTAQVRDGDTIVVASVPVRLNCLHCPERSDPGGDAATVAMRRLVAGERVTCDLTGEQTYDREVGRCSVDGEDLGAALIRQGVCARCPRYDPMGRYVPAQSHAGQWVHGLPSYCR